MNLEDNCTCKSISFLSFSSSFITFSAHPTLFIPTSPTSVTCTECSTVHNLGINASCILEGIKRLILEFEMVEVEKKRKELEEREEMGEVRCEACRDDEVAMYRPDLHSHDFAIRSEHVDGNTKSDKAGGYQCIKCGRRLAGEPPATLDWTYYFRERDRVNA